MANVKVSVNKKAEIKVEKPKQKRQFTMMVEAIAPISVQMSTWAYDENEALEQLRNPGLCSLVQRPDVRLAGMNIKQVTIKDAYTQLIKLVKNF
jgi:hypothetical protein